MFSEFSESLLASWRASNCVILESVDSTNRLAREVAKAIYRDAGEPRAAWFVALEQSAGRGRLGRRWESVEGAGIYATLLLPLPGPRDRDRLLGLPLAVGVAVCRALRRQTGNQSVGLKWPNDIVADGRKVCGVLIEVVEGKAEHRCVVVGIGVNHGHTEATLPLPKATSLNLLARAAGTELANLTDCIADLCQVVGEELALDRTLEAVLDDYRELSVHQEGDSLTWLSSEGPVEGRFEGFDPSGSILLRTDAGRLSVSAGDVLLPASRVADGTSPDAED